MCWVSRCCCFLLHLQPINNLFQSKNGKPTLNRAERELSNQDVKIPTHTVDGQNPAPVDTVHVPLFTRFYTSQVVQDFVHQQYLFCWYESFWKKRRPHWTNPRLKSRKTSDLDWRVAERRCTYQKPPMKQTMRKVLHDVA